MVLSRLYGQDGTSPWVRQMDNRLVYAVDGKIVGAMQVMKTPGGPYTVANTYVAPNYRRKGIATKLNQQAESLYGKLERSEGPSESGDAFRKSLDKKRSTSGAIDRALKTANKYDPN